MGWDILTGMTMSYYDIVAVLIFANLVEGKLEEINSLKLQKENLYILTFVCSQIIWRIPTTTKNSSLKSSACCPPQPNPTQPNHVIFKMQTLFVAFESKIEKANVHGSASTTRHRPSALGMSDPICRPLIYNFVDETQRQVNNENSI